MDTAPISIQKLADCLPDRLAERTWLRTIGSPVREVEYALYWMHHALRADEYPALDVARLMAEKLELPLLVYQGFSEKYRFASERHQTFLLESAQPSLGRVRPRHSGYRLTSKTEHVETVPCWSVMLAFEDRWGVPFVGAFINGGSLGWIARDPSNPARCPISDTWVLPSTVAWAQ